MPLAINLALFVLTVTAFLLLERRWPAVRSRPPEDADNATAGLLTMIVQLSMPWWSVAETALVNLAGGGWIDLRRLPLWLGALGYFFAADFGEYMFHRAQHRFGWMWAMHSLHHSDTAMNTLTTLRHFWLEPLLKSVSVWLAVALLFKVDGQILAIYGLIGLLNFFAHSNLRLGFGRFSWVLNSPQYHRLHHGEDPAHHNANFAALLPIWDVLFRSYHPPARDEFPPTGLGGEATASATDVLIWPLKAAAVAQATET